MLSQSEEARLPPFAVNALASSTAGLIGRILCHPIDTCKAKIQVSDLGRSQAFWSVVGNTWRTEGIVGFYRGDEMLRHDFGQRFPFAVYLTSGMVAEALCCALFIPVDVVKERLQVQAVNPVAAYHYRGSLDALKSIARDEGVFALYRGYWATVLSYGPFTSVYFVIYEEMKRFFSSQNTGTKLSLSQTILSSGIAGSVASYITNPLDVAKLRLQVEHSKNVSQRNGFVQILTKLYINHGLRGLFRGAAWRVLFHTPSTAITMAAYEQCKSLWSLLLTPGRL